MADDDRPKKSWRDIDKAREKSRERRDPDQKDRQRVEKTAAYSKYKSNLDKLFTPAGAGLPEHLRAQLGPASPEAEEKKRLTEALKATPGEATLRPFLEKGWPLPAEPRLLLGLLDLKDESLLVPVLRALLEIVEGGTKPSRMLLLQRLTAIENFAEDDDVKALIAQLRAAL